ncbi:MAG: M23 family metallopeptidase [Candidatus Hatepunaea meridiana]|nr:M23 family metallopeptidase [Candidatus Hatepunaea meridiana]
MSSRLNIIIVPDKGGDTKRYRLSVFWLKFFAVIAGIIILALIAGVLSYSRIAQRALDYDRLNAKNEQLEIENQRIIRVAREVEQSRQILAQIIRSLGGHLDVGRLSYSDTLLNAQATLRDGDFAKDADFLLGGDSYAVERIMAYSMPTCMPAEGFISQGFHQDYLFPERSHLGIDIAGKTGEPIVAAAAGRITFSGWTPYFGKCIIIAHRNGYLTFYGHNLLNLKSVQNEVRRGEPIALLGTTGQSSAPHLHFEIWKDGVPVDPMEFVQDNNNDDS